jgi:hypothetical protein
VIRWGNDDSDAYIVNMLVLLPAFRKNLQGTVYLIPVEKTQEKYVADHVLFSD